MRFITLLIVMLPTVVLAQETTKVSSNVPADIFNYFTATAALIIISLVGAIIALWRKQGSELSKAEHEWLKALYEMHNVKDVDGIYTWMTPRSTIFSILAKVNTLETVQSVTTRLDLEQEGRRQDIERLMSEQKEVFIKGLELTGKLPLLMNEIKRLLERVEVLLSDKDH